MSAFVANLQVALDFLNWARPAGPWVLTAISTDRKSIQTRTFEAGAGAAIAEWLEAHSGVSNLYWMTNRARGPLSKKASKEDVEELNFLHVDCDPEKGADLERSREEILARLQAFVPPPSAIVDSGGGYQGFWRLDEPLYVGGNLARAEEVEAYNQQLELVLRGDHCFNIDRVMRLPGTWNLPDEKKKAAGRTARVAAVVGPLAEAAYALELFTPAPRPQTTNGASLAAAWRVQIAGNLPSVLVDDLPETVSQRTKMLIVQGSDPDEPTRYASRSEALFAVCCDLVRVGCDDHIIAAVILDPDYGISASVLENPRAREYAARQIQRARDKVKSSDLGIQLSDFYAYMPTHSYIFAPNGEHWPAASVNSRIPPIPLPAAEGEPPKKQSATSWLDKNRHVEQMTWCPGEGQVIENKLVSDGEWIDRPGCAVFNLYRPPTPTGGEALKAGPWLDLVRRAYPDDAAHIITWLAHRAQRPGEKINHTLFLGGSPGIGKDTLLEPLRTAVGSWNLIEVSPKQVLGRFNGFLKSVILRVSETRDLGEFDRYSFYEHMKTYQVTPPHTQRCDEKHLHEYPVFNLTGIIMTSNHKTDGIYLPADDRRHYVAWSPLTREEFEDGYFRDLYRWYQNGGTGHVAAYLREFDLSGFDPKAAPLQTPAFWEIVAANGAPEDAEMADALERLGRPDTVTIDQIIGNAEDDFRDWLRKNRTRIPHRLQEAGYTVVPNPATKDKMFKVRGRHQRIYAKRELSPRDAIARAEEMAERMRAEPEPY
jgi:hypothetical protein